jgi:ATP-dependent helicase/nuclease subunit B
VAATPSLEVARVRPGPTATAWLMGRIRGFQRGDPLRPVTVAVPGHHVGLHLRRRLAGEGYASVRFVVLAQLAEALGAARLAAEGRAPLTAVTRAAVVRRALRTAGDALSANADQAGLVDLVAALALELRRRDDLPADAGRVLATGTATARAALLAIAEYERLRREARQYDEVDLLDAAATALEAGDASGLSADLGTLIVHLPARLDGPDARLIRGFAGQVPVLVALPDLEGTAAAELAARLGVEPPPSAVPVAAPAAAATAVVAADPIEEVRAAVRGVLSAMEGDRAVALHRAAIVHADEDTYGTTLRDTLRAAGVTPVALGGRPLAESVAARGLLGLIRLRDQEWSRPAVLAWLSGLPHRGGAQRSQARWDQLSRDAGAIRGADQWRSRLTQLADSRARQLEYLETTGDVSDGRRAAIRRDIEDARAIAEQVAAMDLAIRSPEEATWAAHVGWALGLRDRFVAADPAWSAEDQEASQMVEEVVRGLAAAQDIEPTVSVGVFLRALDDGLRTRRRPDGRLGAGVVIGPPRLLLGMDFDSVHILGAVEGVFPATLPVDPLLAGDPLERQAHQEAQSRRDWLAALAAGDGGEVVVSAPAIDAEGRAAYPSPWLLELLGGQGAPLSATSVRAGTVTHPRLRRVGAGAPAGGTPLHVAERREQEAAAAHRAGVKLSRAAVAQREDLPLGRVLETVHARRSDRLTEFDGNLAAVADLPLIARGLTGTTQSATGVQSWATCPFRFLMGRVLWVAPTEDVEDERWWQMDAAERGSLIHRILERFFREVAASGRPEPGAAYGPQDVLRIETIAAEEFESAAARGVLGHPLVWDNQRNVILADLRTLLRQDAVQRGAGGWRPAHLEQGFGMGEGQWPPVTVTLSDGRTVVLRGAIDRVDRGPQGFRVVDYKTGKDSATEVSAANRLQSGRAVQLALYARAVRERERAEGRPVPAVRALYWFCTTRGKFAQHEIVAGDETDAALTDVVDSMDAGVRAGCFPQVPGAYRDWYGSCENCQYCDYDGICPTGRDSLAEHKGGDPALAPYRALRADQKGDEP